MKMSVKKIVVLCLSLVAIAAGAACGEEIKVGGGGASMSAIFTPVKSPYEAATGDTLIVLTSSPKDGLVDLLKGKVDLAAGAVPLASMVAGAEKEGMKVDVNALLVQEIGRNRTVVLVHPSNNVAKLTKEQLKGIFTGKITNWKEVGGEDKDVIVVWGKGTPGQNAQFVSEILDGEAVAKDVLETTNYLKIKESVAATPEGIGIDPSGMVDATVKAIDAPLLTSGILAITLNKPPVKVQRLLEYLRGKGSKYVKQ